MLATKQDLLDAGMGEKSATVLVAAAEKREALLESGFRSAERVQLLLHGVWAIPYSRCCVLLPAISWRSISQSQ